MTERALAIPADRPLAVVVARAGRLPAGADETVAEARGHALVVGSGSQAAAAELPSASAAWWADTGTEPGSLAALLGPLLDPLPLVVLPASPDGRDLAPRLAAHLDRPLLAGAVRVDLIAEGIRAELLRVDGRVVVPVEGPRPAVATLLPGARSPHPLRNPARVEPLNLPAPAPRPSPDAEAATLIRPDPATMDLADARRVFGGGAGLVPRAASDQQARAIFVLLSRVAAALGASAGATRVVTDAGWAGHERQIGTTGVAINPDLYVALGVSGASQHIGGLGNPRHVVSVNTDPSCPMTAMANLGLICDAGGLLVRLAQRLGVPLPAELAGTGDEDGPGPPAEAERRRPGVEVSGPNPAVGSPREAERGVFHA